MAITAELERRQLITRWRNDPVAYVQERLRLVTWSRTNDILCSVRDHAQTVVRSANGIGKTEVLAALTLWWLETRTDAIVLTTGSSWTSLAEILWPRIHKLREKNNLFPDAGPNDILRLGLRVSPTRYAYAKSSNEPEGVAGAHSPNMLVLVDEASGLEAKIAEALDGNVVGENDRILWSGNPLLPTGVFFEKCHSPAANIITISALEHPNVVQGKDIIPGAVSRKKVEARCKEWGRECDPHTIGSVHLPWIDKWYMLDHRGTPRIKGEFPESATSLLFPRAAFEACMRRTAKSFGKIGVGVDPAQSEFGDETAFAVACQNGILHLEGQTGIDQMQIAGRAIQLKSLYTAENVLIDSGGGFGGGVIARLKELNEPVNGVNFAESASSEEKKVSFANIKAEMYYLFAEQIKTNPDYFLPNDQVLLRQACDVRVHPNSRGQDQIESKEEYKKRNNGESPDRLEACVIANYAIVTGNHVGAAILAEYNQDFTPEELAQMQRNEMMYN